ncbi:GGDEF domain-containing protein [Thiospirochaeta perfilievii]|uniref:diguanylate cyclase n=1 Tax=Thiospirochaeta perfilievii TaxID=252967 RepID=A0A5C1Q9E6_9SPIO|nr:GGDEF domain-containing protein [Thiospirochaeta perfilievii]QEN03519.1 GGDEF domain-containing protein [Thiospirochaeta perfilievii]
MEFEDISLNPLYIKNYSLLNDIGIFDYIQKQKIENKELENLIEDAYTISTKKSITELVDYLIECLSSKFIPSDLVIIINQEIINNKLKVLYFKNLKKVTMDIELKSLEPFEEFFKNHNSTISYYIFESEIKDSTLVKCFKKINTEIIIPIIGHSGLYGLVLFGPKILDEDYTNEEVSYIDRLMKFISIGIQNNIHYEHSVKDLKTGLYNHTFFIRRVNEEIARAKRRSECFTLMMMDIDKFKNFNDTYGHIAGDVVICAIANKLKEVLREEDVISRFGGEEFTVLLPETKSVEATIIAERIRKSIQDLSISYEENDLKVTISIGVTVFNWATNHDVSYLINKADEALYRSKELGRNRVTLNKPGLLSRISYLDR